MTLRMWVVLAALFVSVLAVLSGCSGDSGSGAEPTPEETAPPIAEPTEAPTPEPTAAPTREPAATPTSDADAAST